MSVAAAAAAVERALAQLQPVAGTNETDALARGPDPMPRMAIMPDIAHGPESMPRIAISPAIARGPDPMPRMANSAAIASGPDPLPRRANSAAIASGPDPLPRRALRDVLARAVAAISVALELMRFTRSYLTGGPFRNEPFGATPRMPAEPLWPALAPAFARLATEIDDPSRGPLARLVEALTELQRQLLFEADCAESTDALNNSRQYLQAAGYLDLAAAELALL